MEYYELNNPVFAVQGDNIFDLKIKNLIDFHKEKEACLTIVLREVDNVEGLGIADIDKCGRIQRFVEKPASQRCPKQPRQHRALCDLAGSPKNLQRKRRPANHQRKEPLRLRLRLYTLRHLNGPTRLWLYT